MYVLVCLHQYQSGETRSAQNTHLGIGAEDTGLFHSHQAVHQSDHGSIARGREKRTEGRQKVHHINAHTHTEQGMVGSYYSIVYTKAVCAHSA